MEHDAPKDASFDPDGLSDTRSLSLQPDASPDPAATLSPAMLPVSFRPPARSMALLLSPTVLIAALIVLRITRPSSVFQPAQNGIGMLCILLVGYLLLMAIRLPLRFTISGTTVETQYPLWRRTVPFSAVTNISRIRKVTSRGGRIERVRIDLRSFATLYVPNLRNGPLTLYDVIRLAWQQQTHVAAAPVAAIAEPLTKLATAYEPEWRRDPSRRSFPQWVAPAMIVLIVAIVLFAPHSIWRNLRGTPIVPPDTTVLATYPGHPAGWAGAPVPIFPGESLGERWNVDYKTGALTHSQTDFYIGDSIPINVTRVFLNRDSSGAFGEGTGISYDLHPVGDADKFTYLSIIVPEGETFHFSRTSPGTSWSNAEYSADEIRGASGNPFAGATIVWNGAGWTLRMTDGTLMNFPAVRGWVSEGREGLISLGNANGDLLRIDRDAQGNILRVTSPHGAFVTFKHDPNNRITSATDYLGKTIVYDYDADQHLVRVDDSSEGITHYTYNLGNLIKIVKPDGTTWLKVNYDDHGRVHEMLLHDGNSCRYEYHTDAQGLIAAVDVIPSNGPPSHISLAQPAGN